ncbi:MAG: hypothetical protein M3314_15235, partial [Actinomycetota bacterium]|nr:hypothetical protein [Actinomycetota bacterium]
MPIADHRAVRDRLIRKKLKASPLTRVLGLVLDHSEPLVPAADLLRVQLHSAVGALLPLVSEWAGDV